MTEALIPDGEGYYVVRRLKTPEEHREVGKPDTHFKLAHWDNRDELGTKVFGGHWYSFNEAGELVDDMVSDRPVVPGEVDKLLELIKSNPDAIETGGPGAFY